MRLVKSKEKVFYIAYENVNGENQISQTVQQCTPDTGPRDWKTASSIGRNSLLVGTRRPEMISRLSLNRQNTQLAQVQ